MSFLNYTFYVIFSYYNKGADLKSTSPQVGAMLIYTIIFGAQLLSLYTIFEGLQNPYHFAPLNRVYSFTGMVISGLLAYLLFVKGGKASTIYNYFKGKAWANSRSAKVAVWLYVVLSILSPFILAIARNAALGRHLY